MTIERSQLTTTYGWQFVGNAQHSRPRPYPAELGSRRVFHGCLYQHQDGHYLYQFDFDNRGNAGAQLVFADDVQMHQFFDLNS